MKLAFHHIGVACRDLDAETSRLAVLGYSPEGSDFMDPVQGVAGRFLAGGGPRLELLTPRQADGVLTPWLNSGVKLYHLAYETEDVEAAAVQLQSERARIMVPPVAAVAFGGRKIAFLLLPNLLLIELIASS